MGSGVKVKPQQGNLDTSGKGPAVRLLFWHTLPLQKLVRLGPLS